MVKKVGLSQKHKKMIEVSYNSRADLNPAGLFYVQGKAFYKAFKNNYKNGYETIQGYDVPNLELLAVNFMLYHLAIELMLKALLSLKEGKFNKEQYGHHAIYQLLLDTIKYYPELSVINQRQEYKLLIEELGKYFDAIRYSEGVICLRHNARKGWQNKKPLQELSEVLEDIYFIVLNAWHKVNNII